MSDGRHDVIVVQLKPDEFDVAVAALGVAAKCADENPRLAKYGGGDNARRVRKTLYRALRVALEEREAADEQHHVPSVAAQLMGRRRRTKCDKCGRTC